VVEYRILGPLEVEGNNGPLRLGERKQRALLALLLLNANRVVSRERLIDLLWDERPPASAVTKLQGHVSGLRKVLPASALVTRAPGYLLEVEPEAIDMHRFERLVRDAGQTDPGRAAELLRGALALWRGPPLAEFAESFARVESRRLDDARLAALEARIEADLSLGRHTELVGELESLIAEQPQRERLRAQLMLALYSSGRQADALAAYHDARAALGELGIEPSEPLRQLQKRILGHDETLGPTLRHSNLPDEPTPLVGRGAELAEVLRLVRENKVVTLTGAGGSGKTRLALRAARALLDDYEDGVWLVSLAPLTDPSSVEQTIAQVVGARGELNAFLRGKRMVLLLDNLEQLLPEAAATVAGLETKVLATSRERLRITAEHEYPVPTLPVDDAIELFAQRARQLEQHFRPDEHVPEIVRRLDGLPLAVELAAARVKTLTPEQILERIGQSLELLTGGARDAPDRQQTLRATLEWSHRLLEQEEQLLFARLAVFVGGCTLDAAEQVAGAQLDVLQSLVDKNLLRHSNERFWMLETIRELALEKLELVDGAETLRNRHAEWVLEFVRSVENVRSDAARFARLKAESSNVDAAVGWALKAQHPDLALALASTEQLFISPRRRARWLDAALLLGDRADPAVYANALRVTAGNCFFLGEFDRAEVLAERSLEQFRALGNRAGEGKASHLIGLAASERGEYDRARERVESALELAEASGDAKERYRTLHSLGELDCRTGKLARATALLEQALHLALGDGDTYQAALIEHSLGDAALAAGDGDPAERWYLDSLSHGRELDHLPTIAYCLAGLASLAAMRGETERAGRLWGASQAFQRATDAELLAYNRRRYEEALAAVLGPEFESAATATREKEPAEALLAAL
jgi:predicted ATPase/DNA-binding SARP family transcriptional activator